MWPDMDPFRYDGTRAESKTRRFMRYTSTRLKGPPGGCEYLIFVVIQQEMSEIIAIYDFCGQKFVKTRRALCSAFSCNTSISTFLTRPLIESPSQDEQRCVYR
jgi:hypothetical protein